MRSETRLREIAEALRPQGSTSELTQHSQIILILDRTLSPAGERRLKDLRCLGRGAEFSWPSPGVYSIPKLALKINNALAQQGLAEAPLSTLPFEEFLIGFWLHQNSKQPLSVFESELKRALKFACLGLSKNDWIKALEETEKSSNNSSELSQWGERILLYLEAWQWCLQQGKALSPWDSVYNWVHNTSIESLQKLPWVSILERHPFHTTTKDISFVVPEIQSPHSLETAFLKKLSQIFSVTLQRAPFHQELDAPLFLDTLENISANTLASLKTPDDASLSWAFDSKAPGPVESLSQLSGQFPLDVTAKNWEDDNETLRLLSLYCSYIEDPSHSQHSFLRFHKESSFLQKWELSETPTPQELVQKWRLHCEPEFNSQLLLSLESLSFAQLSQIFLYLSKSSFFRIDREPYKHPRLSAKGVPLMTLPDLALSGSENVLLWGQPHNFSPHMSPQSSAVLKNQEWPLSLRKIFEDLGYGIPESSYEQELLLGSFQCLGSRLKVIETQYQNRGLIQSRPSWKHPQLLKRSSYSPSALEAYAECSFRYYIERVKRPESIEDWDPLPFNALHYGIWVHAVLEKFLQTNEWDSIDTLLPKLILEEQQRVFSESHSPAYNKILEQEQVIVFERLRRHLTRFEAPLLKILGSRKNIFTEAPIHSQHLTHSFNGKIDRIDQYNSGLNLLWDYKTGKTKEKILTQIKNNKFQWPLYKELLKSEHLKIKNTSYPKPPLDIAGGGYLNPLDSSGSYLFFFASKFESTQLEDLVELCEQCGHKSEIIDEKTEAQLEINLNEKLIEITQQLSEGIIAPTGDLVKNCRTCASSVICGKPYLETETLNETEVIS